MVYFLIPAYEEEATIGLLLYKIRQVMEEVRRHYSVIVLDDGSRDSTAKTAERYSGLVPVKVLRNPKNRGFGRSLDRLLREASRRSQYPERDIAITLDADFSWSPDSVPDMVREIEAGSDVVIGARALSSRGCESMPLVRRATSRLVSIVLRAVMPLDAISDYTSTFRAYRVGLLKRALSVHQEDLITSRGLDANVELLLRLGRFHPTFSEIPVHCRFDISSRPSRYDWRESMKRDLSLTGRVERVALPRR